MEQEKTKRRPSMNDVAAAAGVSQSTVSLVLNNPDTSGIPVETRERVYEAVRTTGYRTNRLARAMKLDRTDTFGLIGDDIATTPYANLMIKGAQDTAWQAGKLLLVVNTGHTDAPDHRQRELQAVDELVERQVDGLIISAMFHRVMELPPNLGDTRTVILDAQAPGTIVPSVAPDEYGGAKAATEYLIAHGHTKIAHLASDYDGVAARVRLQAFKDTLRAAGIPVVEDYIVEIYTNAEGGRAGAERLLDLADRPTAVFAFNDQAAMGTYQAAKARGLSVPEDLSVIGFDNQQLIAAELMPPLTTMELPHYEMGRWAVEALLAEDPPPGPFPHLMPCALIERDSVREISP